MAVTLTVVKWDRLKRYVHPHLHRCMHRNLYACILYMYRIVPGKHPWALEAQAPQIRCGRLQRRRCLNISVQPPTPDPKFADRCYWIDPCRSFVCAFFLAKWGQRGNREGCILLENGATWSLVARASQRLSLAVRKFRTVLQCEIHVLQAKNAVDKATTCECKPCCQMKWQLKLIGMIAATVYMSSNQVITQEFCVVDGYTEEHENHRTVKIEG